MYCTVDSQKLRVIAVQIFPLLENSDFDKTYFQNWKVNVFPSFKKISEKVKTFLKNQKNSSFQRVSDLKSENLPRNILPKLEKYQYSKRNF